MKKIIISDVTLRDGNHAVNHSINSNIIKKYCQFAEKAKISVVEVGHGNGIGASSISIGRSKISDQKILRTARLNLNNTKLFNRVIYVHKFTFHSAIASISI